MSRKLPLQYTGSLTGPAEFDEALRQTKILGEQAMELCRQGWFVDPDHTLLLNDNEDGTYTASITLDDTEGLKP